MGMFLLVMGGLLLTAGDIVMKEWMKSGSHLSFIQGLVIWVFGLVFLALSFKYKNIAVASTILVLVNIVSLAIISWLHFNEPLTKTQMAGIAIAAISIVLLE